MAKNAPSSSPSLHQKPYHLVWAGQGLLASLRSSLTCPNQMIKIDYETATMKGHFIKIDLRTLKGAHGVTSLF
jgi:hypothetical protein